MSQEQIDKFWKRHRRPEMTNREFRRYLNSIFPAQRSENAVTISAYGLIATGTVLGGFLGYDIGNDLIEYHNQGHDTGIISYLFEEFPTPSKISTTLAGAYGGYSISGLGSILAVSGLDKLMKK